jgi:hypothetical protein
MGSTDVDHEIRQRILADPAFRVVRWTAPWIALALLFLVLSGMAGDFRRAAAARETSSTVDATATVDATKTAETKPTPAPETKPTPAPEPAVTPPPQTTLSSAKVAVALEEGIVLREEPNSGGTVIDRLANRTEMIVLEERTGWLKVKDPLGRVGWIRANESLVSVKQKQ